MPGWIRLILRCARMAAHGVVWYGHHGDVKKAAATTTTPSATRIMTRFFILECRLTNSAAAPGRWRPARKQTQNRRRLARLVVRHALSEAALNPSGVTCL
jgi:hypothetical protein